MGHSQSHQYSREEYHWWWAAKVGRVGRVGRGRVCVLRPSRSSPSHGGGIFHLWIVQQEAGWLSVIICYYPLGLLIFQERFISMTDNFYKGRDWPSEWATMAQVGRVRLLEEYWDSERAQNSILFSCLRIWTNLRHLGWQIEAKIQLSLLTLKPEDVD